MAIWIILATLALCIVAIFRLCEAGHWNEAALLTIAVAAFVLDRMKAQEKV